MSTLPTLAVTGSTGALGSLVADLLEGQHIRQRLLARTPAKAPTLPSAVAVPFSYADRAASVRALEGVNLLFMVSATEAPGRVQDHRTFIDAAVEAGVEHIVYTSFFGAAPDSTFTFGRDHYATEEYLKASGLDYTMLRDNFYLDFLPSLVGTDGVIRGPAGDGRVAAVARADVARVAAAVLTDPARHRNATYELTGPEALSMVEIADILSQTKGQPVSYHNETIDEAYQSRLKWPAEAWQYDAWVSNYVAIAKGELDHISADVAAVTGQEPISLRALLAQTKNR